MRTRRKVKDTVHAGPDWNKAESKGHSSGLMGTRRGVKDTAQGLCADMAESKGHSLGPDEDKAESKGYSMCA